ncbi:Uncharacterized membrane protein [Paraoerskovia marina]|uniref:Uncharacterized membrane protein n=1 Tax=Paraoerskovia marina TaxID=545619 RepID=A0A1H1NQ86_9CELL|nr:DUF2254 domain-containing protein [Paraoerskovia marina]SDS01157.1 Uncharacterized membrane protein [Paraoerskovia marina]
MRARWASARESFWFLPTALGVSAMVLAQLLVAFDRLLVSKGLTDLPLLDQLSASGGRAILTAIAGSVLTVAATSFSITISVMATTSSAYGPRLVRNFMADRANQLVLAVFTSTFLYSLVVLLSVRDQQDGDSAFVPTVAVHVAVILAVLNVAFLVFFIHHIALSVQVTTLQTSVRNELVRVVGQVYEDTEGRGAAVPSAEDGRVVESDGAGYVQYVDVAALRRAAKSADSVVTVLAGPGDHVAGEPLARVVGVADDDVDSAVRGAVTLGSARTPTQDVRFAVQQLTEMAVRALSPGTNDPYTAASAFDGLAAGLCRAVQAAPVARGCLDDEGELRVVMPWPGVELLIDDVLVAVRTYALGSPVALHAAIGLVERMEDCAERVTVRSVLSEQVRELRGAYDATEPLDADAQPVRARLDAVSAKLAVV